MSKYGNTSESAYLSPRELNEQLNAIHKQQLKALQNEAGISSPPAPPPPLFKALSDLEHHIDELEVAIRGLQFRLSPIMESGDVALPAPPAEHAASGGVVVDIERASYRLASLEGFVAEIQSRLHV